jgi:hypothetical protein
VWSNWRNKYLEFEFRVLSLVLISFQLVQAHSAIGDLECHRNDIWAVLAGMDEWVSEVAGEQCEMGHRVTVLEHVSYAPDAWTVVEDWERGVEEASKVEGELEIGEEEEEDEEVDAMEERGEGEREWGMRNIV